MDFLQGRAIGLFLKTLREKSISDGAAHEKTRRTVASAAGFYRNAWAPYAPLASFNVRCFVSGAQAIETTMPISRTAASTIMVE